ncbi:hypothetical protein TRSC58_07231 [Trypanosoma rangeli SC58]|uniref:Uncharacterized protein n=1 Tax=Trypanosoma rangeli SC58 TaxID=429131 RepID=A0A061IT88_TRYRA|nr:hypothetical protein TRSC58_07231 [Trypanosoma rangeli SC58]
MPKKKTQECRHAVEEKIHHSLPSSPTPSHLLYHPNSPTLFFFIFFFSLSASLTHARTIHKTKVDAKKKIR